MPPVIAAALVAAMPALGATIIPGLTVASVLGSLIFTGALIGLQLLLAKSPPAPADGKQSIAEPIPARIYAVGTNRLPGRYLFFEVDGNGRLHIVKALLDNNITDILQFYIDDDLVTITNDAGDGYKYVDGHQDGRYGDNVISIKTAFGQTGVEPFPQLRTSFPEAVDANFTGTGIFMMHAILRSVKGDELSKRFPNLRPQISPVVETTKLYDPRDEAQDPEDPDTWEFSDNSALAILYYECFCEHGPHSPYDTAILPVVDRWIAEADICDELVFQKGGIETQKRYTTNYAWTADTDEKVVRASLLAACDGHLVQRGDGTKVLTVGKFRTPTVTVTDDDITGLHFVKGRGFDEGVNELIIAYISPAHAYGRVEADPWRDDDQVVLDGQTLSHTIELKPVNSLNQSRRLAKREYERNNAPWRGTLPTNMGGIEALGERWINVQTARTPQLNNTVIELTTFGYNLIEGGHAIGFIPSGPHIDDYDPDDPNFGDGNAPPVKTDPGRTPLPVPENVHGDIVDHEDGFRFDLSWDDPGISGRVVTFVVRYRLVDDGTGGPGEWVEQVVNDPTRAGGRVFASVFAVLNGELFEVQVASVGAGNSRSNWSESVFLGSAYPALDFFMPSNSQYLAVI